MKYFVYCIVSLIAVARGFVLNHRYVSNTKLFQDLFVGTLSEVPPGGRKIVDTPEGAIIVTNQDGNLYAVNAKCPHLGLPMKTGEVCCTPFSYELPFPYAHFSLLQNLRF